MRRNVIGLLGVLCLVSSLVLVGGCASAGSKPTYSLQKGLELGKVKRSEYRKTIGEPTQLVTETNSDGSFEYATLSYAQATMASVNVRTLTLEFRNDLLNGYSYISSCDDDKTQVDPALARQIKPNVSTRNDVLKLLGQPHGRATVPTYLPDFAGYSKPSVAELWRWTTLNEFRTTGGASQIMMPHAVTVGFDADGVVREVAIKVAMDPKAK